MLRDRLFQAVRRRLAKRTLPIRVTLWDGADFSPPPPLAPAAHLTVHNLKALLALVHPTLGGLARCYVEGDLDWRGDIRDIVALGEALCEARPTARTRSGATWKWWRHTMLSDRRAISSHYDVGNDFYGLWLDRQRVYSCAYFKLAGDSLDLAQEQKLEHICRKLVLQPGEYLLDVGCGWGALILWAARHYRVRALGITLSEQQYHYALSLIRRSGLQGQCEVRLCDYRQLHQAEQFDKIASIGMFEHVGLSNLPAYFRCLRHLLKPGGMVLNHGITATALDAAGLSSGIGEFIERYVFPGGELAHLSRVIEALSRAGLECWDVECLRPHYAKTLWHWVSRLEAAEHEAKRMVGENKYRVWRIYMAGSAYAFERGWMSHYQVLAGKPLADGKLPYPLTRDHVYFGRQPQLAAADHGEVALQAQTVA